jgi:hypothetical protein
LGNADSQFAQALNGLADLRRAARYLRAPLTLTVERGTEILTTLRAMRSHVDRVSPGWPRPVHGGP